MFRNLDYETYINHIHWMSRAIALAELAGNKGEIPVGAVIVDINNNLVAEAGNLKEQQQDPTAHAELIAIRLASQKKNNWRLNDCTLYVTLEPCPMCTGAIINSRINLLVYGADDPKTGAILTVSNIPDSACSNHRLQVLPGVLEDSCRQQLQTWFVNRRKFSTLHPSP